jgi:hypothetical protein
MRSSASATGSTPNRESRTHCRARSSYANLSRKNGASGELILLYRANYLNELHATTVHRHSGWLNPVIFLIWKNHDFKDH